MYKIKGVASLRLNCSQMQILVIYETFSIYKKCLRHCRMEMKKKEKSQKKVIKDTAKGN